MPDLQNLKILQGLMPNSIQQKFTLKFGGILDLLRISVKVEAVTALAQIYDPPLRCFLFQYFLLAPTLEKFELYVNVPKNRKVPYMGMRQKIKPKDLVVTLGISQRTLCHIIKKIGTPKVIVQEQCDRAEAWRIEHSNLDEFANNLVRDIPRMFKRADDVANFHNTPQEVLEFIKLYDVMLKEFKAHLKRVMDAPL
ncbi:hypothetical protein KIW84_045427 [Lathyrus oleraceus]|uniref:DUF7745 domain-containing protein n=1 Tax=Pisum sativum TaxID=3888 RepID=A0A9D5AX76_PEA|nr:hypothetical protein KIW84_045427 [Pisum sativum]